MYYAVEIRTCIYYSSSHFFIIPGLFEPAVDRPLPCYLVISLILVCAVIRVQPSDVAEEYMRVCYTTLSDDIWTVLVLKEKAK